MYGWKEKVPQMLPLGSQLGTAFALWCCLAKPFFTPNPAAAAWGTKSMNLFCLLQDTEPQSKKLRAENWEKSVGKLNSKPQLAGLVTVKKQNPGSTVANGRGKLPALPSTGNGRQHSGGPVARVSVGWCLPSLPLSHHRCLMSPHSRWDG